MSFPTGPAAIVAAKNNHRSTVFEQAALVSVVSNPKSRWSHPQIRRLLCGYALLAGLASTTHLLAANSATGFSTLGELSSDALSSSLANSTGQNRLRLLLIAADRYKDNIEQARDHLRQAQLLLDSGPSETSVETAYAAAIACDLRYRSAAQSDAFNPCEMLKEHLSSLSDPYVRSTIWRVLAFARHREGALTESLDLSRLALDAAQQTGTPLLIAESHIQRGSTFLEYGLPERALASFSNARSVLEDQDQPDVTMTLSALIGSSQLKAGHADSALKTFLAGLQWAEQSSAHQRAVALRDMVAQAYLALEQPNTAVRYLEGVFAGPVPDLPAALQISALITLARAYCAKLQFDLANTTFGRAELLATEVGDASRRRAATLAYAEALTMQQSPEAAVARLLPLTTELRGLEPTQPLVSALNVLAQAYAQLDQYDAAYRAQTESRELQRLVQSSDFERLLSYQRAELELDRQADELSLLRAREQSLRTTNQLNSTILASLILLGIIGALLIYLWMSRRLQRQATLAQQQAAENLESQVIARTQELENELANRLLLQEERRQLEANLAEGDKLRTIGQLTSGVAHDFNNLMTVVTLSAELLQQGSEALGNRQQQCVDDILLAADSGSKVTSGLLAYARQQSLEPETLDLVDYIQHSQPLFQRTLGEGVALEIDLEPTTLVVDRANLTTALINLLVNAGEAMGGRGELHLNIELVEQLAGPRQGQQPGDWVKISVTDTGRGMTQMERERAFEPFFTTKSGGKGSGLGLSMVYGFAKQSGGELEIQATATGGTQVIVWLPSSAVPASDVEPVTLPWSNGIESGATVLLVEDQAALRSTLRRLLESMNLKVLDAADADTAVVLMQDQPAPDLLLSDVIMPGQRTGNELADELRQRFPELPVLLMSGYTDLVDLDYPLLQKPFSLDELRANVATALAQRQA
ncbi:MAG: ATP-binding protein [Pseudomonadales bacterium]